MDSPYTNLKIREEKNGEIVIVTIARPPVNALNGELLDDLNYLCGFVETNKTIRVLVLMAEGKVFSAGADLKERESMNEDEVEHIVSYIRDTFTRIADLPVPVVCVINGIAVGGGLELALTADFRMASKGAKLGLRETALAIIPGGGGTQRLPRLIGENRAKWWIMTARMFTADEALRDGVVNAVAEPEDLNDEAIKLAREIAQNGPLAMRQAKIAIRKGLNLPIKEALELEKACYGKIIATEDRMEGIKAFREKRNPVYKGK